jgi:hypothetical protein
LAITKKQYFTAEAIILPHSVSLSFVLTVLGNAPVNAMAQVKELRGIASPCLSNLSLHAFSH